MFVDDAIKIITDSNVEPMLKDGCAIFLPLPGKYQNQTVSRFFSAPVDPLLTNVAFNVAFPVATYDIDLNESVVIHSERINADIEDTVVNIVSQTNTSKDLITAYEQRYQDFIDLCYSSELSKKDAAFLEKTLSIFNSIVGDLIIFYKKVVPEFYLWIDLKQIGQIKGEE